MINNEEALGVVESAVADTETEIARLDAISRQIELSKQAIQRLRETDRDIRSNAEGDVKKRASSLAMTTTHLELAEGDLGNQVLGYEVQKKRVIEVGKQALSRVMGIWSLVHRHCRDLAEQEIRLSFDTGRLLMPVDHLVACRLDVLMAKQLQDRLFSIQYADPNGLMEELRRIRERFDQAAGAVKDEPSLVLNLAPGNVNNCRQTVEEPAAEVQMSSTEELVEV